MAECLREKWDEKRNPFEDEDNELYCEEGVAFMFFCWYCYNEKQTIKHETLINANEKYLFFDKV